MASLLIIFVVWCVLSMLFLAYSLEKAWDEIKELKKEFYSEFSNLNDKVNKLL